MKNVVSVCVAVIAFSCISACVATKQGYVSRGNKLYDAGKYQDAVLNYRKAIQRDPKFGEAYYRLGLATIKLNEYGEAYKALFRAVQLLPNNVNAKEKFAEVCLSLYLADPMRSKVIYDQLTQVSNDLLKANSRSYEALVVKGYLAESDRNRAGAIKFLGEALQVNSTDAAVSTELVALLIQNDQVPQAEQLASDMMNRQKTSFGRIYDIMYSYYYNAQRVPDAEKVLKVKVDNNPKHAGYILQLARHYARVNSPVAMKQALQRILDDPKDFPEGRLWVGNFYMLLQDYDAAILNYQEGARSHTKPKERAAYQDKIMLVWLAQGKTAEATEVAREILKTDPQNEQAERLEADDWLNSGKHDKVEAALSGFQKLSAAHPDDPVLHYHLGRAYRAKEDLDMARKQFLEAAKRRDFLRPRYELVEIDLMEQHPDQALQQANEILSIKPGDPRGTLLHARCLIAKGEVARARTELSGLLKSSPKNVEASLEMGHVVLKDKQYKEAADLFQKVCDEGEPRGCLGLATTYSSEKRLDKAMDALRQGLKRWPESTPIMAQLATTEALAGNYDLAITHFQRLLDADPKSAQWQFRIGEVCDIKGDMKKAIEMYQQASDLNPDDQLIALTLADALARAGRTDEAKRKYQGIVKAHPDNATALNNLAYLLADAGGDLDEALRLAQQALSKIPTDPGFSDTIGYVYLKKGQRDSAMQTFNSLVRKYPNDPHIAVFRYHLGMAFFEKGDKAGAKKELLDALKAHPAPQDEARIKQLLAKT